MYNLLHEISFISSDQSTNNILPMWIKSLHKIVIDIIFLERCFEGIISIILLEKANWNEIELSRKGTVEYRKEFFFKWISD